MKNYNERDCVQSLNRKRDCRIHGNLIEVSKDNGDVGLKSWRKISYLCKVHGYRYMITNFAGSTKNTSKKKYKEDYEAPKTSTKKGKINLKAMVENIMSM